MENSTVLARIIGPILVIIAVGILFNLKAYRKLLEEFTTNNTALVFLSGLLALFFGLLIVEFHNVWKLHWSLIITILGWGGLVKGVVLSICPKAVSRIAGSYKKHSALMIVWLLVVLAIGIFLTVMGYRG